MAHPTTEESISDKETIGLSGQPNRGFSCVLFSLPPQTIKADVSGVVTLRLSWNMTTGQLMEPDITLTLKKRGASQCASPVIKLKGEVRSYVPDVEGKDTMFIQVKSVGPVSQKQSENEYNSAGMIKDESVIQRAETSMNALTQLKKSLEKTENGSR